MAGIGRPDRRRSQVGAAMILFLTVLVLGVAWYTVGALGKAARSEADKEIATGKALQAAKLALLAYVARNAADSSEDHPGRLPCPEHEWHVGLPGKEGVMGPSVGLPSPGWGTGNCASIGRLPWRTLGVDQIRDGSGELLWYAVTPGIWSLLASATTLNINPGTLGQLDVDGQANAAAAVIIAPGAPLNTQGEPGTPVAPCAKVNQMGAGRNTAPLATANFLECGNTSGSYSTTATSPWSNDRVIVITAAEVMEAIAGPVGDRLQRTVAPVLAAWDETEQVVRGKSWGTTWSYPYLPYASAFTDPATNDYCGDAGSPPTREGLPPMAGGAASGTCLTNWSGTASLLLGLQSPNCAQYPTTTNPTHLRCRFLRISGTPSARITATAPNVAGSFRGALQLSDITATWGGSIALNSSLSDFSPTTGVVTLVIDVTWPVSVPLLQTVEVLIPHLPDAVFMSVPTHASYTDTKWFRDNNWARYTYYAVAPSATLSPTANCSSPGDSGCIQVRGLAASTGNYWDKRLALVLAGPPLADQSRSCATDVNGNSIPDCGERAHYFEEHNASMGDRIYRADLRIPTPSSAATPYPPFNDRVAACPFRQTRQGGTIVTICN